MTEREGWFVVAAMAVVGTVLIGGPTMANSRTSEVVALGITALVTVAVVAYARRRARATVPQHLEHLEVDDRRLVVAMAERGERAPSPHLAEAVVAHARGRRSIGVVMLVSGVIPVGTRLAEIASGASDAGTPLDLAVIGAWVVTAGFLTRNVLRARRAIAANRPPGP